MHINEMSKKGCSLLKNKALSNKYPNPAIRNVIASVAKQSRLFMEIAAHLSGARNDTFIKRLRYLSLDLGSIFGLFITV